MRSNRGVTLLELLVVLVIAAVCAAEALPRVRAIADRVVVHHAAVRVRSALGLARQRAVALGVPVAVYIDSTEAMLRVGDAAGGMSAHPVGAADAVRLRVTRDSIAFSPIGLGWGASNTSVVVARGAVAETVTVSRAGRIR